MNEESEDTEVVLMYKEKSEVDAGFFYCPYVPLIRNGGPVTVKEALRIEVEDIERKRSRQKAKRGKEKKCLTNRKNQ